MHTLEQTLTEAKLHLEENLALLEQLKGKTPKSMLADFRLRYVTPLEELVEHLQREIRKDKKTDKPSKRAIQKLKPPRKKE